jgi:hypothetical protein
MRTAGPGGPRDRADVGPVPAGPLLAGRRARPGPRWHDPAELARQQAAEFRAARARAGP